MSMRSKAVVAMSGGVDSSVAAAALLDQGYEVIGVFLDTGVESGRILNGTPEGSPCPPTAEHVQRIGDRLGIHVDVLERHASFQGIVRAFVDEYVRGRTPNPCVLCNERFKFVHLLEHADEIGAEVLATGHYARALRHDGAASLARGLDRQKDQSYYLFRIGGRVLSRLRLPMGEMTKDRARERARALGLPVLDRPESQDVCFASRFPYVELVRRYHPDALQAGQVCEVGGRVVGEHAGLANYTIGQRHGLGIALGRPMYVAALDPSSNVVTLGEREALLQRRLTAVGSSWQIDPPTGSFRARAQIRYRHEAAWATVTAVDRDHMDVVFDEPQWAITPGQAVVVYDGEIVLGGGWIEAGYDA